MRVARLERQVFCVIPVQGVAIDLHVMAATESVCRPLIYDVLRTLLAPSGAASSDVAVVDASAGFELLRLLGAFPFVLHAMEDQPTLVSHMSAYGMFCSFATAAFRCALKRVCLFAAIVCAEALLAGRHADRQPGLVITISGQAYVMYDLDVLASLLPPEEAQSCLKWASQFNDRLAMVRWLRSCCALAASLSASVFFTSDKRSIFILASMGQAC